MPFEKFFNIFTNSRKKMSTPSTDISNMASEESKTELNKDDNLKLLGQMLVKGVSGNNGNYIAKDRVNSAPQELEKRFNEIRNIFNELKNTNKDISNIEILQKTITTGEHPLDTMDISQIIGNSSADDDTLRGVDLFNMSKSLGVISEEVPTVDYGELPAGEENHYFSQLLQNNNNCLVVKGEDYKVYTGQPPYGVTEFINPTSIEGVNFVVDFIDDSLIDDKDKPYFSSVREVNPISTKIKFTPKFIAETIGVAI